MKRRIVIGALLAALAFSMAACGSTGGTDGAADGAGQETELNSILTLISLGLTVGSKAVLRAEGPDEEKAIERIGDLFEYEFDFPPRR